MRCEDASRDLAALARGESVDDETTVLEHLAGCPGCGDHELELEPIRDIWRRSREVEIDLAPDAWSALAARITSEPRPRRRPAWIYILPPLVAAAAILLFAFLVEPTMNPGLDLDSPYGALAIDDVPLTAGESATLGAGSVVGNAGSTPARIDLEAATFVLSPRAGLRWIREREFELVSGAILVRADRPMTVRCAGATVDVLGTEFLMTRTPRALVVQVLEGRVRLAAAGRVVDIPRGARASCAPGGEPSPVEGAPAWPALAWLGRPRLELTRIPADGLVEFEITVENDGPEEIPIRPFSGASPDFLLEIETADGSRFPLKILPGMVVEQSRPSGHRATWPLESGHPYRLRVRLEPSLLGDAEGPVNVTASYNVRGPAGEKLWQGRLTSQSCRIRR